MKCLDFIVFFFKKACSYTTLGHGETSDLILSNKTIVSLALIIPASVQVISTLGTCVHYAINAEYRNVYQGLVTVSEAFSMSASANSKLGFNFYPEGPQMYNYIKRPGHNMNGLVPGLQHPEPS